MLPSRSVSQHCIEDREKLPSEGNEGNLGRLAGPDQLGVEGLENRVEPSPVDGGQVERGSTDRCTLRH